MSQREVVLEVPTGSFELHRGSQSVFRCLQIRCWNPEAVACKICSQTPSRKTGRWALLPLPLFSAFSLGGLATLNTHASVNNFFPLCYTLLGPMNKRPIGFQNWIIWDLISWVGALKVECQMCGPYPSFLRESRCSLLTIQCCARDSTYSESMSHSQLFISIWVLSVS